MWHHQLASFPSGANVERERLNAAAEMARCKMIMWSSLSSLRASYKFDLLNSRGGFLPASECDLGIGHIAEEFKGDLGGFGPDYLNCFDPRYQQTELDYIASKVPPLASLPYFWGVIGGDEYEEQIAPGNGNMPSEFYKSQWNQFTIDLDNTIKSTIGGGVYGIPSLDSRGTADEPFQWMAFQRWAAGSYNSFLSSLSALTKGLAPQAKFSPGDITFVGICRIPYWDFEAMGHYTDQFTAGAYVGMFSVYRGGMARYSNGCVAQILSDLTGVPAVVHILQFFYSEHDPLPKEIREWSSQVIRSGGNGVIWYTQEHRLYPSYLGGLSTRYVAPHRYAESLHVSKVLSDMNELIIPPAEIAIFFCTDSVRSLPLYRGTELHAAYGVFGPEIGGRIKFVSDNQIQRGVAGDISRFKMIIVPYAKYIESSVAQALLDYVSNGGTLVIGDPMAFYATPVNGSLSSTRSSIIGTSSTGTATTDIKMVGQGIYSSYNFPLYVNQLMAYTSRSITQPSGTTSLFTYTGGTCSAWSKAIGSGTVIYFTSNPFQPETLVDGSYWVEYFRDLAESRGCAVDSQHWRFLIPE